MFPTFITGEPKRDYDFSWVVSPHSLITGIIDSTYISQLAQKVDLPEDNIQTKSVPVGTVEFPVPVEITLNSIKVTYLEDDLGSVYMMHRAWQNLPRQKFRSFSLNTMFKYSGAGLYIPKTSHLIADSTAATILSNIQTLGIGLLNGSDGSDSGIPTGYELFPHIFPTNIQRTSMDKGGQSLAGVTVTYTRLPEIKLPKGRSPCASPAVSELGKSVDTSLIPEEK